MKNLKVSDTAHKELKIFAAIKTYDMSVLGSEAIIKYLKENGHKFSEPKSKSKTSKHWP